MRRLEEMIAGLKALEIRIFEAVREELETNAHIISDMISEIQLFEQGVDGTGTRLDEFAPYTAYTIRVKREKGQPTDRVTLRDEGDFHNSIDVVFAGEGFEIIARDTKTEALKTKYGKEILALTDAHFNELAHDYVAPAIHKILRDYAAAR